MSYNKKLTYSILIKLLLLIGVYACSSVSTKKEVNTNPVVKDGVYFVNKSNFDWLEKTAKVSNCVLNNKQFQSKIKSINKFDYTSDSGGEVLSKYLSGGQSTLFTYRSLNPWTKVIAYTLTGNKNDIFYNTRKLNDSNGNPREIKLMVNTTIHERGHLVGYGHGNNSSHQKDNSVPYLVGSESENFVEGCL